MVVFGPDEAEPLLGCTAVESAGFKVDPRNQTVKKIPRGRAEDDAPSLRIEPRRTAGRLMPAASTAARWPVLPPYVASAVSPGRRSLRGGGRWGAGTWAVRRGPRGASR